MILIDYQIKELCEKGFILNYEPELINPSSIDARLGEEIYIETENGYKPVDLKNYTKENPYLMTPGEFILGCTLEYFQVPDNICVELKLKSSRAREGLSHALAGHVDNGFHGSLTLELKNYLSKGLIHIYYGMKIAQAILHQTEICEIPYKGRYSGFNKPILSKG